MAHLRAGREAAGPSPAHRDIFMIGVYTGMRLGEVVSLRWERVDLERRVLRVEETKAGEPLELPGHPAAGCRVRALPRQERRKARPGDARTEAGDPGGVRSRPKAGGERPGVSAAARPAGRRRGRCEAASPVSGFALRPFRRNEGAAIGSRTSEAVPGPRCRDAGRCSSECSTAFSPGSDRAAESLHGVRRIPAS